VHLALVHQPEVRLVHERGWLEAVPIAFVSQLACGDTPQLRIHERHQSIERARVAASPIVEQAGDVRRRGRRHFLVVKRLTVNRIEARGHAPQAPSVFAVTRSALPLRDLEL
jgi:hypothetical protein